MITNTGKSIIAKYLLGQAQAYASYIAVGCGKKPLDTVDSLPDYSAKENLDFEMFRVPISSRGYVIEDGISKVVLTAELPTEERYEISEVGMYSAGSNPAAGSYDSKTVLGFTSTENWKQQDGTEIITISGPLDGSANNNNIETAAYIFETNADNRIFFNTDREQRYERCRFLNNVIALRGDSSTLSVVSNHLTIASGAKYIKINGTSIDFSKNTPKDQLRLALSVINKTGSSVTAPDNVKVLIEFTGSDTAKFARFEAVITNGTGAGEYDLDNNRYCVITKELQELYTTNDFTWNSVNTINIYASAATTSLDPEDFYILLDALRFENVSTQNPLYGLTGYSVIQNDTASTVIKSSNTSNYLEFRFALGVS
jgi:hypothetical protein